MAKYVDFLIEEDGIAADEAGMPIYIYDRDVVQQDIVHALRESRLLEQLIAERSPRLQKLIFKQLRMIVENDLRVVPGSSEITAQNGTMHISAQTEFGPVNLGMAV